MGRVQKSSKERVRRCRERKSDEEKAKYNETEKNRISQKRLGMTEEEKERQREKDRQRKAKKVAEKKQAAGEKKKEKEKIQKRKVRAERSELEVKYENIVQLIRRRQSRANRTEEQHLQDNLKAKEGMQRAKSKEKVEWRYYHKMTDMEIWETFWRQGTKERALLKEKNPEVDAKLRAKSRENFRRHEEENKKMKERNAAHDQIMQESAPEGFVWSGGIDGDYHWAGEGPQPESTKDPNFWQADLNPTLTEEDEENLQKQREEWLKHDIEQMKKEKAEYQRNYQKKKKAALQEPILIPEAGSKSEYELLQERNIREFESLKKASGLFDD